MKKNELKRLIKPVVKECIHEVLLEEGLLSNIVAEVAKGMQAPPLVETKRASAPSKKAREHKVKLSEHRKKMIDAIGKDSYNGVDLFEGTSPLSANEPAPGAPDLGSAHDSGVDISSLVGDAAQVWRHMK